jgi:holliday junction DNA helicase RuvA
MIGKLKGIVDALAEDHAIIDVHGVGFVIQCSTRTLGRLPRPGEAATLAIETQVREDSIKLYGFASETERDWFRLLQLVQGVGAKVALAILGVLGEAELAAAIARQDKTTIARAPGVGPKLAARIAAELKDKGPATGTAALAIAAQAEAHDAPAAVQDAVSALINLGYGRPQAVAAIAAAQASLGEAAAASALIRLGLKELAQ